MPQAPRSPEHPGLFIRRQIIPPGMSVTEAANRLGVGRPALSNLLNGNSSLSQEMAVRLAKTFDADRNDLLKRQADFDRPEQSEGEKAISVLPYVPPFLTIKSLQIDEWANKIKARQLLPVLLRTLVISTHDGLRRVTFPGHDDGQRRGWDGLVEADSVTPWIPEGLSCWEFGTSKEPKEKANRDYRNGLSRDVPFADRRESTFVFVTPRRWEGVTEWADKRQREGHWKAVKGFDASALETWLTQSIPAQVWLAEKLGSTTDGVETLNRFWQRWSSGSCPKLTPEVFRPSVVAFRKQVTEWLGREPERPLVVAADSKGEAIAFLACLFRDLAVTSEDNPSVMLTADLAAIFDSPATLRLLAASRTRFLPIVSSEEVERELAPIHRRLHSITVRSRNGVQSEPDIALELLNHEGFVAAIDSMGIDRDRAERLDRESGRSPTILRRRLSTIGAIRVPEWAADGDIAKRLIPMALIGAWHRDSDADCEVMGCLAHKSYEDIDKDFGKLLHMDDSPVWSAGRLRGVASKIDSLFAIKQHVTEHDLNDFFWLAEYVLSETDPALDLPEEQRWAAGFYGKVRNHSAALRRGICETLAILSVHGDHLFLEWPGVDVEARVPSLIRRLLTPLTLEELLSHKDDLPRFAEAAPDQFLRLIENDLAKECPAVFGLLKPAPAGIFGHCLRTELLWALECLAWENLARVSRILGQLSGIPIDDNWVNKPLHSLEGIYRSWNPQTAASLEERVCGLEALTDRFPDAAWQVCLKQLPVGRTRIGDRNYRPRWRGDASGAGRSVTNQEKYAFERRALDLAIDWPPGHDEVMLGDLLAPIRWMLEGDQHRVWRRIEEWADSDASDRAKAELRERIRRFALTRFGQHLEQATIAAARRVFEHLQPDELVARHAWLFSGRWIEPSVGDTLEPDVDFSKHQESVKVERGVAMAEIWATLGFEGLTALLQTGDDAEVVGESLGPKISGVHAQAEFVRKCLANETESTSEFDGLIRGFLHSLDQEGRASVFSIVAEESTLDQTIRLLRCGPFRQETWDLVDRHCAEIRDRYWSEVELRWASHAENELNPLIDRLLGVKRPRAALWVVNDDWSKVETARLKRLLFAVASAKPSSNDGYGLEAYRVERAIASLRERSEASPDDLAQLEYAYIDVLVGTPTGVPNLEQKIGASPGLYFQALALAYHRQDYGQDPPEWRFEDRERFDRAVAASKRLLSEVRRLPGTQPDGSVDVEALLGWVGEVRRLCAEHDRTDIGDRVLGEFLARVPTDADGMMPPRPVCEVLERIASSRMGLGYERGIRKGPGDMAQYRPDSGEPERRLAAKYEGLARQREFEYPFVSSIFDRLATDYEQEAKWHDAEGAARKRIW